MDHRLRWSCRHRPRRTVPQRRRCELANMGSDAMRVDGGKATPSADARVSSLQISVRREGSGKSKSTSRERAMHTRITAKLLDAVRNCAFVVLGMLLGAAPALAAVA